MSVAPQLTVASEPSNSQVNGQLDLITSGVLDLDVRLGVAEDDINDVETDLESTQDTVSEVQTDLGNAEAGLASTIQDLNTLSGTVDTVRYGVSSTLQSAITNDRDNAVDIELAQGTVPDTTTINIINGTGGGFRGKGVQDLLMNPASAQSRGHSTRLYTGSKTGSTPHIYYDRANYFMEHCSWLGQPYSDILSGGGTKTPIWMQMTRASGAYAGIGTGKLTLNDMTIGGYGIGINRAGDFNDSNCDENSYKDILFARCGVGFQSNNLQGLSDKWYNLRAGNTPIVFNYLAGGKLTVVDSTLFSPCTLLKLNGTNPTGFGPNNSRWSFHNTDLDSQARNTRLLDCDTAGVGIYGHIWFNGGHLCRNGTDKWENEVWHMGEIGLLKINDFFGLHDEMIKVTAPIAGAKTTVIVENCVALKNYITNAEDLIHPDSTGNFRLIVRNLLEVDSTSLLVDSFNEIV